jgi:hypothetical protein
MARTRRKSPDKLLSRSLEVLGAMVDVSEATALGEFESYAARMTAVAKAVVALARVEHDRWAVWNPRRLRHLSDDELAAELERDAKRAIHGGAN